MWAKQRPRPEEWPRSTWRQEFTTGSSANGYTVTSVGLHSDGLDTSVADFSVSIYTTRRAGMLSGSVVGTPDTDKIEPRCPTRRQHLHTHRPHLGTTSTTYFVVVDGSAGTSTTSFNFTNSDSEDAGGNPLAGASATAACWLWKRKRLTGGWTTLATVTDENPRQRRRGGGAGGGGPDAELWRQHGLEPDLHPATDELWT